MCAVVKQGVNEMLMPLNVSRHCEEHLRRSNPVFGSLDCFAHRAALCADP
jgi:hypothetical protein